MPNKKCGIFTVCSGREYRSIRKICLDQGLKGLVVSFQGARIHDLESGKVHPNVKSLDGDALKFANGMVQNEKHYVQNSIDHLKQTYEQINAHKLIDTIKPDNDQEITK